MLDGGGGVSGVRPAAQFEEQHNATCGMFFSRISLDSGPRVIPTAWAPIALRARISEGDSNWGH